MCFMLFLQEKSDQQVFLFSFKRQFFPEFRMGNADQFLRPLGHGLAAQFGYAVFRYDVVDIVLARRNDSARCQGRHDFADRIIAFPSLAVDGKAMKLLPPLEEMAPRT